MIMRTVKSSNVACYTQSVPHPRLCLHLYCAPFHKCQPPCLSLPRAKAPGKLSPHVTLPGPPTALLSPGLLPGHRIQMLIFYFFRKGAICVQSSIVVRPLFVYRGDVQVVSWPLCGEHILSLISVRDSRGGFRQSMAVGRQYNELVAGWAQTNLVLLPLLC